MEEITLLSKAAVLYAYIYIYIYRYIIFFVFLYCFGLSGNMMGARSKTSMPLKSVVPHM